MSDETNQPPSGPPPEPQGAGETGGGLYSQQVQHVPVSARVPSSVVHGVFCTGVVVLEGPDEFVIDFIQGMVRPPKVGARVVLSANVVGQFVEALRANLRKYEQQFGPPRAIPRPPPQTPRPSIQDLYQDLRMSDEQLAGVYATTVMISHSPAEFCFDFIARFFPAAVVAARVYMSAPQVPPVLEAMNSSVQRRQKRLAEGRPPAAPPPSQPSPPPQDGML